ncbi:MAG: aminoacyl-tRNA hydrolase [Candidatus Doudnabacteria bacterium]|nr:aminoacyl-tRNA hydrolase [bacterium]MDZ4244039.1 aminoacyl-tRNA hydrolase [Candidatus Doudnabacteria bacterium]
MNIKIIVGLGNPEEKYKNTRHNMGFIIADALAKKWGATFVRRKKFDAITAAFDAPSCRAILAKPQTYMNDSGRAVQLLKKFFKVGNTDILIAQDEIDLPFGKLRLNTNSGSAGHKGAESVIASVGRNVPRLRIGIENRGIEKIPDTESYVLQNFTPQEKKVLSDKIIPEAIAEIEKFLEIKNTLTP